MSEDTAIEWFLLERYITGHTTAAERAYVEEWAAAHADHQHLLKRVHAALGARHRAPRDWRRAEAIDAVMARVRAGDAPALTAAARMRQSGAGRTPERLIDQIRRWFEGTTELAAAMLLDARDEDLTTDEVTALRTRIDQAKREPS